MRGDSIMGIPEKVKVVSRGANSFLLYSSSVRFSFCSLFRAIDYRKQIIEHLVRVYEAGLFRPVRKDALWMEIGPCSNFGSRPKYWWFCHEFPLIVYVSRTPNHPLYGPAAFNDALRRTLVVSEGWSILRHGVFLQAIRLSCARFRPVTYQRLQGTRYVFTFLTILV